LESLCSVLPSVSSEDGSRVDRMGKSGITDWGRSACSISTSFHHSAESSAELPNLEDGGILIRPVVVLAPRADWTVNASHDDGITIIDIAAASITIDMSMVVDIDDNGAIILLYFLLLLLSSNIYIEYWLLSRL